MDLKHLLPGLGLALGPVNITTGKQLTWGRIGRFRHLFHSFLDIVVHEGLLMGFSFSGLDKLGVLCRSRVEVAFVQKTIVTEIGAEELVLLVLLVRR